MVLDSVTKALTINECVQFVISLLVWPPALVTFAYLTYRSYREGHFGDAFPLLLA